MRSPATTPAVIARVARFLRRGAFAVVVTVRSLAGGACAETGRSLAVPYGSDRLDRGVDRPRARDPLPAGERAGGELVVDAERERHAGARPADVPQLDVDGERKV